MYHRNTYCYYSDSSELVGRAALLPTHLIIRANFHSHFGARQVSSQHIAAVDIVFLICSGNRAVTGFELELDAQESPFSPGQLYRQVLQCTWGKQDMSMPVQVETLATTQYMEPHITYR